MLCTPAARARAMPGPARCPVAGPRLVRRVQYAQVSITPVLGCSNRWRCRAASADSDLAGELEGVWKRIECCEQQIKELVEKGGQGDTMYIVLQQRLTALQQEEVLLRQSLQGSKGKRTFGLDEEVPPSGTAKLTVLDQAATLERLSGFGVEGLAELGWAWAAWAWGWVLGLGTWAADVWEVTTAEKQKDVFLDPSHAVERIENWLSTSCAQKMKAPRRWQVAGMHSTSPAKLIISGVIKSGKTFVQNVVVPAVVANYSKKHPDVFGARGPLVFRFSADIRKCQSGAELMLAELLRQLLVWAKGLDVAVDPAAWRVAVQIAEDAASGQATPLIETTECINDLLGSIDPPIFLLLDEFHLLLAPKLPDGSLDSSGAATMRDVVLKMLLIRGPSNLMYVITGSSMSLLWIAIAKAPPNGTSLLLSCRKLVLPDEYSQQHMLFYYSELQQQFAGLSEALYQLSEATPAMLWYLASQHEAAYEPGQDLREFVGEFVRGKLLLESANEWVKSVHVMSQAERVVLFDLTLLTVGSKINVLSLGLKTYLQPHLRQTIDGERWFLRNPTQRQLVQLLITPDGNIKSDWADAKFSSSLVVLEGRLISLQLGETADYLHRNQYRTASLPRRAEFMEGLEELAAELEQKAGPWSTWPQQPFFRQALDSPHCSADKAQFTSEPGWAERFLKSSLDMLIFYLRLRRNVLAHGKPFDVRQPQQLPAFEGADVEVAMALPALLGTSPYALQERLSNLLYLLGENAATATKPPDAFDSDDPSVSAGKAQQQQPAPGGGRGSEEG